MVFSMNFLNKTLRLLFSSIFCIALWTSAYSRTLSLPLSLSKKPIYHLWSNQLEGWSCGYNVLWNACKLEHKFNKPTIYTNPVYFRKTCTRYLKIKKIQPHKATDNVLLHTLAAQLGLTNFTYMIIDFKGRIVPVFLTPTAVTHPVGLSKIAVNQLLQNALYIRQETYMQHLKKQFISARTPFLLHFACHHTVGGINHVTLISAVKTAHNKRLLIVCDNLNTPIIQSKALQKYLTYFCDLFII